MTTDDIATIERGYLILAERMRRLNIHAELADRLERDVIAWGQAERAATITGVA